MGSVKVQLLDNIPRGPRLDFSMKPDEREKERAGDPVLLMQRCKLVSVDSLASKVMQLEYLQAEDAFSLSKLLAPLLCPCDTHLFLLLQAVRLGQSEQAIVNRVHQCHHGHVVYLLIGQCTCQLMLET